jgi:kynureninase
VITRHDALGLDSADPLGRWRHEFLLPDPDLAYLDGNSLGMPPKRSISEVERVMREEWAGDLIRSWSHWVDLPQRTGAVLAPLLGVDPDEVVVHDSTTLNIYQHVHIALAMRPDRRVICVEETDFPTDLYVVQGIAARTGHEVRCGFDELADAAVVLRSLVDYRTAAIADLAGETQRARESGAVIIWDLSHAVGVLDLDLHAAGVELAVGCSYKYLCGGPGAPAWSYVARGLHDHIDQPIWGWFAQRDQFDMSSTFTKRTDIGQLLLGTPGILGLAAAKAAFELVVEAGIAVIRAKAAALTDLAIRLCDQWALDTPTPRDAARRGGHVSVRHRDAALLTRQLAEHGVIADFRQPDLVRLGCSPLTTRFVDVFDGVKRIADLLER